ncbi:MAG: glycine--tRNA ligase [Phycisphaerales bacterium]|nr:glycine--tRNA ligase [Phycisphaerales bacterium]
MERIVALCKRRGFVFQSSEIYGGINGFWDYGPLGVELKRNLKDAWWLDMVRNPPLGPDGREFQMVGLDCSIIMHPQVWKCSGHYDLFSDMMVDCQKCKSRFRHDQLYVWEVRSGLEDDPQSKLIGYLATMGNDDDALADVQARARKLSKKISGGRLLDQWQAESIIAYRTRCNNNTDLVRCPSCDEQGSFTTPREFNLMLESHAGPIKDEDNRVFLRPETAQGIFVNFKNVIDTCRVKLPFGIAQMGKSFRNEITPRNFTFRSREFEQMEIEFFCHPSESNRWYEFWRDVRFNWYTSLGLKSAKLRLREHDKDELSHYSCGTSDIEYAFPFLADGDFGELEGVAHRGDFDLRSHMEGKLVNKDGKLVPDLGPDGKPKWKGSGKDLTYFDDERKERFTPHVVEPSAGADRATLAVICEAYTVDESRPSPELMRFHPRLAPIKAAVFPLVAKDGMPEIAEPIYRDIRKRWPAQYDAKQSIGKRYARMDEAGTPFCFTIDGQTKEDGTVTVRDRDTGAQERIDKSRVSEYLAAKLNV